MRNQNIYNAYRYIDRDPETRDPIGYAYVIPLNERMVLRFGVSNEFDSNTENASLIYHVDKNGTKSVSYTIVGKDGEYGHNGTPKNLYEAMAFAESLADKYNKIRDFDDKSISVWEHIERMVNKGTERLYEASANFAQEQMDRMMQENDAVGFSVMQQVHKFSVERLVDMKKVNMDDLLRNMKEGSVLKGEDEVKAKQNIAKATLKDVVIKDMETLRKLTKDRYIFDNVKFVGLDLRGMEMTGARFENCEIIGCKMDNVSFYDTHFKNCKLAHNNMSGSEFAYSKIQNSVVMDNNMEHAKFRLTPVISSSFIENKINHMMLDTYVKDTAFKMNKGKARVCYTSFDISSNGVMDRASYEIAAMQDLKGRNAGKMSMEATLYLANKEKIDVLYKEEGREIPLCMTEMRVAWLRTKNMAEKFPEVLEINGNSVVIKDEQLRQKVKPVRKVEQVRLSSQREVRHSM